MFAPLTGLVGRKGNAPEFAKGQVESWRWETRGRCPRRAATPPGYLWPDE